ncbi:MAG: amidohydrolase [Planctomycetales bacterium]|nr:amidohydrolase [Planctomycetales bacterium]
MNSPADQNMRRIDDLLTHVWVVRTMLKHSEEAEEDPQLFEIQRSLYDYMHALGSAWQANDAEAYLRQAARKFHRLRKAADRFSQLQPEISTHTNFAMARRSLNVAVDEIGNLLDQDSASGPR